jgi:acyl carrier protein
MGEQASGVMSREAIRAEIREFLSVNFGSIGQTFAVPDDASLYASRLVDKTGVLELVLFVEEAYGFDVAETDLTPDNFDSVNGMVDYVERRLAEAPGS